MYEMHVIISHQQVIFTGLISFINFLMICTLHMSSFYCGQIWVGTPKMKNGYHRTILSYNSWKGVLLSNLSPL